MKDAEFHLVAYYKGADVSNKALVTPRGTQNIGAIQLFPHEFRLEKLRNPPRLEQGQDGRAYLVE